MERKKIFFFKTTDLKTTNPCIDQEFVEKMAQDLISGKKHPFDYNPIEVRINPNYGISVIDGNHRLTAFKKAGIPRIAGFGKSQPHLSQTEFQIIQDENTYETR